MGQPQRNAWKAAIQKTPLDGGPRPSVRQNRHGSPFHAFYESTWLAFHRAPFAYWSGLAGDAWMKAFHGATASPLSQGGPVKPGMITCPESNAVAACHDAADRWRALAACRDYLRLVARRGKWSARAGFPATSDLVQRTLVDAWHHFPRFQGRTPAQLRAWLKAILVHAALNDRRRKTPRWDDRGVSDLIDGGASPSQEAQRNASREAIDLALERLSERHRMIVRLRIWDRCSFAEIGRQMAISEDAARMLYGRAIARLRETVGPGHDPL